MGDKEPSLSTYRHSIDSNNECSTDEDVSEIIVDLVHWMIETVIGRTEQSETINVETNILRSKSVLEGEGEKENIPVDASSESSTDSLIESSGSNNDVSQDIEDTGRDDNGSDVEVVIIGEGKSDSAQSTRELRKRTANPVSDSSAPKQRRKRKVSTGEMDQRENRLNERRKIVFEKATAEVQRKRELATEEKNSKKEVMEMEKAKKLEDKEKRKSEILEARRLKELKKEEKRKEIEEKRERRRKEEEERKEKRRKEEEERKEKRRKEEDERRERRMKEEQDKERKRKEEEEKRERKRKEEEVIELKKKRQSDLFLSFFHKKEVERTSSDDNTTGWFKPFYQKDGVSLAPTLRRDPLSPKIYQNLLNLASPDTSYLTNTKLCTTKKRDPLKPKLFQFCENYRPPYYGTWRKLSKKISGRRPFAKDSELVDYDVDSDEEWDEPEGDDCDDTAEEDDEVDNCSDDDDGFFVEHGYLSEGEGEDEFEAEKKSGLHENPEMRAERLKALAEDWKEGMQQKVETCSKKLVPIIYGPCYNKHDRTLPSGLENTRIVLIDYGDEESSK